MKKAIKYIELKTGYNHNGPAWIGVVSFSKTGRTIYFNGKGLYRSHKDTIIGNYYDIETGEEYWVSGVKKDKTDRHQYGVGKVVIEKQALSEYLQIIGKPKIDSINYEVCELVQNYPKEKINLLQNEKGSEEEIWETISYKKTANELTKEELDYFIDYYYESSIDSKYLKGRKHSRKKMEELEDVRARKFKKETTENE